MSTMRIWIEAGCIQCFWCQNLCPQVFGVSPDGSIVLADARVDGMSDENRVQRSPIKAGLLSEEEATFMPFLAGGCPSQVIKVETSED
jgi:ferredoxin